MQRSEVLHEVGAIAVSEEMKIGCPVGVREGVEAVAGEVADDSFGAVGLIPNAFYL